MTPRWKPPKIQALDLVEAAKFLRFSEFFFVSRFFFSRQDFHSIAGGPSLPSSLPCLLQMQKPEDLDLPGPPKDFVALKHLKSKYLESP